MAMRLINPFYSSLHSSKLDDSDHVDHSATWENPPVNHTLSPLSPVLSPRVQQQQGQHDKDYIRRATQAQLLLLSRIHTVQQVLSVKECVWIIEQADKGEVDAVGNQW